MRPEDIRKEFFRQHPEAVHLSLETQAKRFIEWLGRRGASENTVHNLKVLVARATARANGTNN